MKFGVLTKVCNEDAGDPRREGRRLAVIEAAESLFLEQGFEGTSLAAIIRRSGGSLATVYDMFANKQGLLRAVVERNRDVALHHIGALVCETSSCAEALNLFGCRLYEFMTARRTIALLRVVIGEALRDPAFGHAFHEDIHRSVVRDIAGAFAEWTSDGRARIDDPMAAAELYLAIVFSNAQLQAMMATDLPTVNDDVIRWRLAPFIAWFAIG